MPPHVALFVFEPEVVLEPLLLIKRLAFRGKETPPHFYEGVSHPIANILQQSLWFFPFARLLVPG